MSSPLEKYLDGIESARILTNATEHTYRQYLACDPASFAHAQQFFLAFLGQPPVELANAEDLAKRLACLMNLKEKDGCVLFRDAA